ncbi:peptidyl-prolyl cis-trans isomerase [Marinobacterium zhoushanense]|uniref:Peptidyl-prolyl cis-trans isomerase n=1 Tax=Marinobacterium zhoushanense TaxID=1679163 RepID=A0ABQ1K4C0_9GAMM|nr:peptidylprolyl isomerase [Marinobacterium zhoushanense]GGB86132.1 peptidyl-prolyl cis-trans isomerase [Marinobacterium zhoushanense]
MTQIADNTVVQFHYTLTDTDNKQIETSLDADPLAYLQGHDNMIPAIEQALEGKSAGDTLHLTLTPDQAYGERKEGSEQRIPLKHLQGLPKGQKNWKPGMLATVHTNQGVRQVTVVKPGLKMVLVDTNHPLAGKTLTYDIQVVDVRPATDEEIAHGHAHGVGGHHH